MDRQVVKALRWLKERQKEDGSWGDKYPISMTAFALLASLNDAQRDKAVLGPKRGQLVTGPGADGAVPEPEGLLLDSLNETQRAALAKYAARGAALSCVFAAFGRLIALRAARGIAEQTANLCLRRDS